VDKIKNICTTFPHDAACQVLLKLINVPQSYSKNKNGDVLNHSVEMVLRQAASIIHTYSVNFQENY